MTPHQNLIDLLRKHKDAAAMLDNILSMIHILPEGSAKESVISEMIEKYYEMWPEDISMAPARGVLLTNVTT